MSIYIEESGKERVVLIYEFGQVYDRMKKKRLMEAYRHFGIYGNAIEVWEYKNGKKRNVCRVEEDSEEECYRKAIELMKLHDKVFW